jgi:hypothetical protein
MVFALKGQDATAQGAALGANSGPINEALKERDEVAFYRALSGLGRLLLSLALRTSVPAGFRLSAVSYRQDFLADGR